MSTSAIALPILATGRVPFALCKLAERGKRGDAYTLLGTCFVEGETFTLSYSKTRDADVDPQALCTVKLFSREQETFMRQSGAAILISHLGSERIAN